MSRILKNATASFALISALASCGCPSADRQEQTVALDPAQGPIMVTAQRQQAFTIDGNGVVRRGAEQGSTTFRGKDARGQAYNCTVSAAFLDQPGFGAVSALQSRVQSDGLKFSARDCKAQRMEVSGH